MILTTRMSHRLLVSALIALLLFVGSAGAFATGDHKKHYDPCKYKKHSYKYDKCKKPTTTSTTTKPSTTTTTFKPTTTSTSSTTTTMPTTIPTTAPPSSTTTTTTTTSTTQPETTTTSAPEPTTTVAGTVVTQPETTTPAEVKGVKVEQLPVTGIQTIVLSVLAIALLGGGIIFLLISKREPRIRMGVDSYRKW